jgi:hypothetical protein
MPDILYFQEGHTSTIKTLLTLGADLHVRDKKGRTGTVEKWFPNCGARGRHGYPPPKDIITIIFFKGTQSGFKLKCLIVECTRCHFKIG